MKFCSNCSGKTEESTTWPIDSANEDTKATYSLQGKARVSNSENDRDIVYGRSAIAEQDHDFAKLGVVVLVDLEKIEGYSGLGPSGQLNQIKLSSRI